MDSINQNQPEHNLENLAGEQAIKKMAELIKEAQTCFFCTSLKSGDVDARPMNVLEVDQQGNLWFMSASDSHKNQELQTDSSVRLFFQGSPHSKFLHLEGTATVSKDKARIRELWKFVLKTWFTQGQDDPRITVIKVTPTHGYYWDNKHGNAVAGIKMMLGAAIGVTLDDSIEGDIKP